MVRYIAGTISPERPDEDGVSLRMSHADTEEVELEYDLFGVRFDGYETDEELAILDMVNYVRRRAHNRALRNMHNVRNARNNRDSINVRTSPTRNVRAGLQGNANAGVLGDIDRNIEMGLTVSTAHAGENADENEPIWPAESFNIPTTQSASPEGTDDGREQEWTEYALVPADLPSRPIYLRDI